MSIFGKIFESWKISLKGNGNVVVQGNNSINNFQFNFNDSKQLNLFFEHFGDSIAEIKQLLLAKNSDNLDDENDKFLLLKLIDSKILFNKYFNKKKLVSEISEKDIFDIRLSSFRESYFSREIDSEIFDKFAAGKNILIIGNSLSGKTRAFYELIRKLVGEQINTEVFFPKMISTASSFDSLRNSGKQIVFFDDIDDFYNQQTIDNFIIELIRSGFQIVATCRTGPEYKDFKKTASSKVKEAFSIVMIDKMSRNTINEFAEQENIDIENSEFDGNIGSIILPIQKMRDRYDDLRHQKNEINDLSINILKRYSRNTCKKYH